MLSCKINIKNILYYKLKLTEFMKIKKGHKLNKIKLSIKQIYKDFDILYLYKSIFDTYICDPIKSISKCKNLGFKQLFQN